MQSYVGNRSSSDESSSLLPKQPEGPSFVQRCSGLLLGILLTSGFLALVYSGFVRSDTPLESFNGPQCSDGPCFHPSGLQVSRDRPGFPSFWNFEGLPMKVSYDERSILINGNRVLFLSGSMHPVRATQSTWETALDNAVANGLNMITIYVMWSAHQALPDAPMDWSLQEDWTLAQAIRSAANRGLFVHARIGPYVCAEYSYGGIPEWVALSDPNMTMRRYNLPWLRAMESYVSSTVNYLKSENLFAYQGGPIVLAQIENELGGEVETLPDEKIAFITNDGKLLQSIEEARDRTVRNATIHDYADWCGDLANRLIPEVVWTMCNGLSANNTIVTFNGVAEEASWLESHGDSGRIQVDQPALWTEDEGGFQIWGASPNHPSDYFWGISARSMAYHALRWFARGGTHLNYYMWWGGYNRGRAAAAGIMNVYASDAPVCPSGRRHQPKFDHFTDMHSILASIAPILLESPSALFRNQSVNILDDNGNWVKGDQQEKFIYRSMASGEVLFVENGSTDSQIIQVYDNLVVQMSEYSSIIVVNGTIAFDSAFIYPEAMAYTNRMIESPIQPVLRDCWSEPIGVSLNQSRTQVGPRPIEQTKLNMDARVFSDYAWFETSFFLEVGTKDATLMIETQKANALIFFLDGDFIKSVENHMHSDGTETYNITMGPITNGSHNLAVLSESLGYSNLIGRFGADTRPKTKGLTGRVYLIDDQNGLRLNLLDGHTWRSSPDLNGRRAKSSSTFGNTKGHPTWTRLTFQTPVFSNRFHELYVDITSGRGHLFLNGRDLGRFWGISRINSTHLSQRYYFLPVDYLMATGIENELILFDVSGTDHADATLIISWIEPAYGIPRPNFPDVVDFPGACLF